MSKQVVLGTWAKVHGTDVSYNVCEQDESVELSFGEPGFELVLSEAALEKWATLLPQALAELRDATTRSGE